MSWQLCLLDDQSILYFDTNYIYNSCTGEHLLKGECSGELTDELVKGEHSFCSMGSKSYTYTTNLGKTVTHVKGFTVEYAAFTTRRRAA